MLQAFEPGTARAQERSQNWFAKLPIGALSVIIDRFRIHRRQRGLTGSESAKSRSRKLRSAIPDRNPINPE
eukprot:10333983-Alexandrium_andersonii.AAC.1